MTKIPAAQSQLS